MVPKGLMSTFIMAVRMRSPMLSLKHDPISIIGSLWVIKPRFSPVLIIVLNSICIMLFGCRLLVICNLSLTTGHTTPIGLRHCKVSVNRTHIQKFEPKSGISS